MKDKINDIASIALMICAIVLTGVVIRREFSDEQGNVARPLTVDGWEELTLSGRVLGSSNASLKVVEFSDFQCPYCAVAAQDLRRLRERYPDQLAVVYRHFPITSIHRHAFEAALAAECAGEQGAFEPYHDALFQQQAMIGTVEWNAIARMAKVPDIDKFQRCVEEQRYGHDIRRDSALAMAIGIRGTPSFIYDGRLITGTGAIAQIEEWLKLERSRK